MKCDKAKAKKSVFSHKLKKSLLPLRLPASSGFITPPFIANESAAMSSI